MGATPAAAPVHVRRLLYMFGAVTQIELNNFLDLTSIDTEDRKREIKAAWPAAAEVFQRLRQDEAGAPDRIEARPLGAEHNARLAALRADPVFVNTFSNYPYSFEEVEIDSLVACQRTVHLDHVTHITARYRLDTTDLIDFCLVPGQDVTPINVGRTAQNAFTASSENPGLRFLGAYEQRYRPGTLQGQVPGGQPVHAILLVLGYGSSTVNVYRTGTRFILGNGFHRLYALRAAGVTRAPVVVQHITHSELELPQVIADLPRDYLVENPRPGLMRDFFNPQLTCEITQRSFLKALQVGWGINENTVPR